MQGPLVKSVREAAVGDDGAEPYGAPDGASVAANPHNNQRPQEVHAERTVRAKAPVPERPRAVQGAGIRE
eukprot:11203291-Lingulodinium_polyedra.AAC.1